MESRFRPLYVGCYFVLLLLLGLLVYKDYGVAWDEPLDQMNGMVSAKYAAGKFAPQWAAQQESFNTTPDLRGFGDNDHGAILEMTLAFIKLQWGITESRSYFLFRHLSIFLLTVFGHWCLYNIGRIRFGDWRIGLALSALLVLSPKLFAESFYNVKDIGFLVLFLAGIYSLVRLLQRPTLGRAVVHGLTTAAAIDLRILGVLLIGLTLGMVVLEVVFGTTAPKARRTWAYLVIIYMVVMAVGTVMGWPYLWEDPLGNFLHAFNNLKKYRWEGEVLYMGNVVKAPELPWHYAIVWITITTPISYLLALVIGTLGALYLLARQGFGGLRTFQGRLDLLFLGWFYLPILMIIVLDSVIYDSWRHLYFVYPALLLLAVRGAVAIGHAARRGTWLKRLALFLAIIAGAETTYTLARLVADHPKQQVYFSFLPAAKAEQLFERDYWGLSYRQGLEWLLQHESATPILINGPQALLLENNLSILKPEDRKRFKITTTNTKRYYLGGYRAQSWEFPDDLGWRVHQIKCDGVNLLDVRYAE